MKKMIALFLALVLTFSFVCPAYAVSVDEDVVPELIELQENDDGKDEGTMTRATLSLGFQLAPGRHIVSSESYYVSNEAGWMYIASATWNPPGEEIAIGWYRVETNKIYYVRYSGGSATAKIINCDGLPDGTYKVVVMNLGDQSVTGALRYNVY